MTQVGARMNEVSSSRPRALRTKYRPTEDRVVDLHPTRGLARCSDDSIGSTQTLTLVQPESISRVRSLRETPSEGDGIFQCLARTLALIRGHGMRCIADQRDSTSAPVTRRPSVVHVVAHDRGVARSRDQGGYGILPTATPLQEVLLVALWPRLLARRFPGHGRPVDAVIRKVGS